MENDGRFVARTVVEQPGFSDALAELSVNWPRYDEVAIGITFFIARRPELGWQTGQPGIWAIKSTEWDEEPGYVWYYSFNQTHVHLEDIQKA